MTATLQDVEARARLSRGTSAERIYQAVASALAARHSGGGTIVDIGCGTGTLHRYVGFQFHRYIGIDVVRYDGLPDDVEFYKIDLDTGRAPLPDSVADVVVAVETIEHLENPRAFARELTRLGRPGGWVVITTPNQLSLLSKLTLLVKNEFNAFQNGSYPAHLTALLETDLRRIGSECGWVNLTVSYTASGRIPGSGRHWPAALSRLAPRVFSDNVLVLGSKPIDDHGAAPGRWGD